MRALRGEQPCNQVRSRPSSVNARPQFRRFIRGGCCSCRRVQHLHDVHGLLRGRQRIRRPLRLQVHLQPQQSRVHHSATLRLQKRPLLDSRTASCGAMLPPLSLAPAPSPKGLKQHRLKKRRLKTHTEVRSRSHQSPKTPTCAMVMSAAPVCSSGPWCRRVISSSHSCTATDSGRSSRASCSLRGTGQQ